MSDELVSGHAYRDGGSGRCDYLHARRVPAGEPVLCGLPAAMHADPGPSTNHLITTHPHEFTPQRNEPSLCGYSVLTTPTTPLESGMRVCGYPEQLHEWAKRDRAAAGVGALVRAADVAQYRRQAMPDDARRGPVVTLVDAPVDPLGTLAVLGGIYKGEVYRSKSEVTDDQRREMLADMSRTALSGPLESIQFTFLVEGVGRDITHQMVRSRFSFFAQESLRFAVAEDWAQEVPLPPALAGKRDDDPAVVVWRKALNQAEDSYAALVAAGMPAEEARKVLPHAITTRLFWVLDLRTLLLEAGKRTCTQAQFEWRQIFAGVAKALRERGENSVAYNRYVTGYDYPGVSVGMDGWQYRELAKMMRPMCYQEGACKMMASFDRGCTIRERVNAFAAEGVPSVDWHRGYAGKGLYEFEGQDAEGIPAIDPAEWATDPSAARVTE